jgi:transposase
MFIRVNNTPNSPRQSVQIVESKRMGDKVKTKILRHVGIAMDNSELEKLKSLANDIINKMQQERIEQTNHFTPPKKGRKAFKKIEDIIPVEEVRLHQIEEEKRIVEGIDEVGSVLFNSFGFDSLFSSKKDTALLKDLILTRIIYPESKNKLHSIMESKLDKEYELQSIYRLMDKIHPLIDELKVKIFNRTRSLFPEKGIDLMLFDVTTLYFESTDTDDLRAFGYSKDHRFNTTQVVLALASNQDGLPVGYELFAGNTAEVKTLIASIEKWKSLFAINQACFIGDRAMFCKDNLAMLDAMGYQYIVAAKLRTMKKNIQEEILDGDNYSLKSFGKEVGWSGEFDYEGRRLICSYKKSRAIVDAKHRQQILDKIMKLVGDDGKADGKKLISNSGVKKFTKSEGSAKFVLDQAKIDVDSAWDGMHGVITNIKDVDAVEIIGRYKRLWVIEDCFRINKTDLKVRPIYHWKKERIEAHIAMCYMSFAILKHLQYQVCLTQKISVHKIIEELLGVQSSIYVHKVTKDRYRVPSRLSNEARKIYKAFNIERSQNACIYMP